MAMGEAQRAHLTLPQERNLRWSLEYSLVACRRFCDECLKKHLFNSYNHARQIIGDFRLS